MGPKILNELLEGENIGKILDAELDHVNEYEDVKEALARKIEADIQQYIDPETWGEDRPVVEVVDDIAYVTAFGRKMVTMTFYGCVFSSGGKVTKELFIASAKEKTAEE